MDLFYPYIPKWVQSAKALCSYDVIKTCHPWKLRFSAENRRKFKKFEISLYKFWISGFHRVFCLYKRKMVIPTCPVSFSIIVCRYFSKWRTNVFLKLKRSQQPPSLSVFDGLPYPRVRWYPQFFFMKMTAKDVKEITYMPLVTFFSVLERRGKNRKGGCNNPLLVRRELIISWSTALYCLLWPLILTMHSSLICISSRNIYSKCTLLFTLLDIS